MTAISGPTSRLIVNLGAYAENLRTLRARLPDGCGMMPVVKSNAYGLGAVPIAKRAVAEGVQMLAVATVSEAVELREAGVEAPILVLVQARTSDFEAAIRHKLRLSISDFGMAEKLGDAARRARSVMNVHCEVDTGMGRQGFLPDEAPAELRNLTRISHVDIEGIYTHFASADSPEDGFADAQLRTFQKLMHTLDIEGVPYEIAHAANSAAALFLPASALDLVRPGIVTYGVWPGSERTSDCPFQPVAAWKTTVVLVRNLPRGSTLSYRRTYATTGESRIASIPLGYADGYPFSLSNRSEVLIRGKRCPVRGRVTMNEVLVDVTQVPGVSVGDDVTLLGADAAERVTVEELAAKAGIPPHAVLTGIGDRVAREYLS